MSQDSLPNGVIKRTRLPKLQLFILYLIQLAEPITSTVVLPFVNQFVRDTGITGGDERKTGYYAGLIGSAFFLSEGLVVYQWGWLSDRVGRRPVLLLGPFGLAIAMLVFGTSTNFWTLVAARCAQGIFNGNIGVAKTGIAEISDPSNLADAYSLMPLVWSLGTTVGPIIGGLLAEPATRWPLVFGKFPYFTTHPYFLPCAVAGLFSLLIALTAFVGLKESSPSALARVEKRSVSPEQAERLLTNGTPNYGAIQGFLQNEEISEATVDTPTPFRGLLIPQVLTPLLVYSFLSFVDMSSQVLMPLMFSTSIPLGGLGFDAYRIGVILSVFGFVNAVFQLAFMGTMVRAFGPRKILALAQLSYVINIGLFPLMAFFARRAGRVDATVWAIIVVQLIVRLTNGMGWGAIQILIVDSAPNKASLGATNGMGQAVGCVARSIGPSVASSLFSLSLQRNLLGGNLVYLVLVGFAALGARITYLLPGKLRAQKD